MHTSDPLRASKALFEDVVATLSYDDQAVPAKVVDLSFRTVSVAVEFADVKLRNVGSRLVEVRIESPLLPRPMLAMGRVRDTVDAEDQTVVAIDVLDWMDLHEQLPPVLRQILCAREVDRFCPKSDEKFPVTLRFPQRGLVGVVDLVDLSVGGVSVVVPEAWTKVVATGDRADLEFSLTGDDGEKCRFLGYVRHLGERDGGATAGIFFDPHLSDEFMSMQLRVMRFVDTRRIEAQLNPAE